MNMMAKGSGHRGKSESFVLNGKKQQKKPLCLLCLKWKRADCVNIRYQHNKGQEKRQSWRVERRARD